MKIYIKSSEGKSYAQLANDIYYRPLVDLAMSYSNHIIPPMILLDFLTTAIEKMREVGCLDWFLNHYSDAVQGTILDNGIEEYNEEEIRSILEEANVEAFAFEETGYPSIANKIINHINEAKELIGDN